VVPGAGFEPARGVAPGDFESPSSASSDTPAFPRFVAGKLNSNTRGRGRQRGQDVVGQSESAKVTMRSGSGSPWITIVFDPLHCRTIEGWPSRFGARQSDLHGIVHAGPEG
jgi:hypothetical protein